MKTFALPATLLLMAAALCAQPVPVIPTDVVFDPDNYVVSNPGAQTGVVRGVVPNVGTPPFAVGVSATPGYSALLDAQGRLYSLAEYLRGNGYRARDLVAVAFLAQSMIELPSVANDPVYQTLYQTAAWSIMQGAPNALAQFAVMWAAQQTPTSLSVFADYYVLDAGSVIYVIKIPTDSGNGGGGGGNPVIPGDPCILFGTCP